MGWCESCKGRSLISCGVLIMCRLHVKSAPGKKKQPKNNCAVQMVVDDCYVHLLFL